jgi:hypothetical protein
MAWSEGPALARRRMPDHRRASVRRGKTAECFAPTVSGVVATPVCMRAAQVLEQP